MKKQMISAWLPGFILFAASLGGGGLAKEPAPRLGGWSEAAVTEPEVVAAANFAIKEQEKAIQKSKGTPTAKLRLSSILSAKTQVVAGINYRFKLNVILDGKKQKAEATVWWQAWRKPDPYRLTSWKWSQ